MNIAFFVSDHGFGHIMRELPVMKILIQSGHNITIVCNSKHNQLAKEYLGDAPNYINMHTDSGIIVIPGTIKINPEETVEKAELMIKDYPNRINFAKELFDKYHIDKVVADIVPWSLKAASDAGVPSFLMASFTWLDQYGEYLSNEARKTYIDCFKLAGTVLYYDLCNDPTRKLLGNGIEVGFVAREFNEREVQRIKSEHSRKIVFLSLGASNSGLDFDIDVSGLDYDFITTEALKLIGDNVTYLDIDTPNTQDYIKAADYCISKPGWTTCAEIMLAGTPAALLKREDVQEDSMTIDILERRNSVISIDVNSLKDMKSVLTRMKDSNIAIGKHVNACSKIAEIVSEAL